VPRARIVNCGVTKSTGATGVAGTLTSRVSVMGSSPQNQQRYGVRDHAPIARRRGKARDRRARRPTQGVSHPRQPGKRPLA
jgi:hypothetical protein